MLCHWSRLGSASFQASGHRCSSACGRAARRSTKTVPAASGVRRGILADRAVLHFIDVRSGKPATGAVRSASVIAVNCLDAGIHASDLCLVPTTDAVAIDQRTT